MLGELDIIIPDQIEPEVGWRTWRVVEGQLLSTDRGNIWTDGELSWDKECHCGTPSLYQGHILRTFVPSMRKVPVTITTAHPRYEMREVRSTWPLRFAASDSVSAGVRYKAHIVSEERTYQQLKPPPGPCHCGINAFAKRQQLARKLRYMVRYPRQKHVMAIGTVKLKGEVREYEHGWRAEHAWVHQVWALTDREGDVKRIQEAAEAAGAQYMGACPKKRWMAQGVIDWVMSPWIGRLKPIHLVAPTMIFGAAAPWLGMFMGNGHGVLSSAFMCLFTTLVAPLVILSGVWNIHSLTVQKRHSEEYHRLVKQHYRERGINI